MSNKNAAATEAAVAAADPVAVDMTLGEFCARLSQSVRRPELIAGFEHSERKAGKLKDTDEAYQARFDKFIKTPV